MSRSRRVHWDGRIITGFDEYGKPYRVCICGCDDLEHRCSMQEALDAEHEQRKPIYDCKCKDRSPHTFEQAYAERPPP